MCRKGGPRLSYLRRHDCYMWEGKTTSNDSGRGFKVDPGNPKESLTIFLLLLQSDPGQDLIRLGFGLRSRSVLSRIVFPVIFSSNSTPFLQRLACFRCISRSPIGLVRVRCVRISKVVEENVPLLLARSLDVTLTRSDPDISPLSSSSCCSCRCQSGRRAQRAASWHAGRHDERYAEAHHQGDYVRFGQAKGYGMLTAVVCFARRFTFSRSRSLYDRHFSFGP